MRKLIVVAGMLAAGAAMGYLFYLSWAVGFGITKYCGGKRAGERGRVKSILIPWRQHHIHLHHWLLSAIFALASASKGFFVLQPNLFYGFLGGVVFQGIYCYTDWYRIVKRRFPVQICLVEEPFSPEPIEAL